MSPSGFAYLASGKLHLHGGAGEPRTLESRFGQSLRDRAVSIQQRHSWKTQGRGARFMAGNLLWSFPEEESSSMRVAITALARGRQAGELLYALETDSVGGVFAVRDGGEEQRLFHSADCRVQQVCADPGAELIACALAQQNGTANLAVMRADGSDLREVTEGDSVDLAPSWVPGSARQLVYQSAGVGRDSDGNYLGLAPFAVHRLDLESGEVKSILEDAGQDLLGPRIAGDGSLLFIRRPYRSPQQSGSPLRALLDFLLFPLRLLFALFQWLNFFTARYTGKPLTTAGGPQRRGADMKQMMIWGNLIDADRAAKRARRSGEAAPDLVPSSWQLVRRRDDREEILAKGVLAFDLCSDGGVLYSNGSAITRLAPGGERERLCTDQQIAQIVALD